MGWYVFNRPLSVLCDWKDISIAHVIIIIKSEVSTFPTVITFFRGCVPEMFVASYSVTYCIYIPGKPGICFHYHCAVYDECKYSDTFWLAGSSHSLVCTVHHFVFIIFSPLSIIQYMGLYVFSLPISAVKTERIYILRLIILSKSEVWSITHCLGLGHETMVSAVCLSIFFSIW